MKRVFRVLIPLIISIIFVVIYIVKQDGVISDSYAKDDTCSSMWQDVIDTKGKIVDYSGYTETLRELDRGRCRSMKDGKCQYGDIVGDYRVDIDGYDQMLKKVFNVDNRRLAVLLASTAHCVPNDIYNRAYYSYLLWIAGFLLFLSIVFFFFELTPSP